MTLASFFERNITQHLLNVLSAPTEGQLSTDLASFSKTHVAIYQPQELNWQGPEIRPLLSNQAIFQVPPAEVAVVAPPAPPTSDPPAEVVPPPVPVPVLEPVSSPQAAAKHSALRTKSSAFFICSYLIR